MGIRLIRLPEYRLNLNIYSGYASASELFRHLRQLDSSANWLSYFDATADLSAIDIAHFPALKDAVTAKEYEQYGGGPRRHALVNVPDSNLLFARFWCRYVTMGVPIARRRKIFRTVEEARRWLGLPPAAQAAITEAIAAVDPAPPPGASAVPRPSPGPVRPEIGAARP